MPSQKQLAKFLFMLLFSFCVFSSDLDKFRTNIIVWIKYYLGYRPVFVLAIIFLCGRGVLVVWKLLVLALNRQPVINSPCSTVFATLAYDLVPKSTVFGHLCLSRLLIFSVDWCD